MRAREKAKEQKIQNQNKLDCVSILLSDKNSQTKSFRVIKKETSQWQKVLFTGQEEHNFNFLWSSKNNFKYVKQK